MIPKMIITIFTGKYQRRVAEPCCPAWAISVVFVLFACLVIKNGLKVPMLWVLPKHTPQVSIFGNDAALIG